MQNQKDMKMNKMLCVVLLGLCAMTVVNEAVAQEPRRKLTKAEEDRIDSLKASYDANELKSQKDEKTLSDLKTEKADTRVKEKEAQRIENDARDAARESRSAYRTEKKAQRSRQKADKQAKKAAKARSTSDAN
jgi:hypothetical protein